METRDFYTITEKVFRLVEEVLDGSDLDVDYERTGSGVLELEFDDGDVFVLNAHGVNQEIWLAGSAGAFHFRLKDGVWLSTRDDRVTLLETLSSVIKSKTGRTIVFNNAV